MVIPKNKTVYLVVNNLVGLENTEEILRLLFSLREFGEINFDQIKFVWLSPGDTTILSTEAKEKFFKRLIEALSISESDKEILKQIKQTIEENNIEVIDCPLFLKKLATEPYTEIRQNEINYYTGISTN